MNKKIIVTLIVLLFCVGCVGIVSADNVTNETSQNNESVDMSTSIMPISMTDNGIEFSDGFTGFCLDLTKESITTEDGFTSQKTSGDEIQNYIKLAIIEAYRQGCEDNLGQIIASFADGSYKNSDDKVIAAVLDSQESIGDTAVVELEDSIEGTFEFKLLKPATADKSDCLAYKVSLKEVASDDKLAAADNSTNESDGENAVAENNQTVPASDNSSEDEASIENATNENNTENESAEAIVNETNNITINETNNVTINENNTTINQNNTEIINETDDAPQNATIVDTIMKTAGNPIFILIVVILIAAIAAVAMRRKD